MSHLASYRKPKHASAPLLCLLAIALSGCGLQWPEWATVNSDPFAFMASEAPPPPPAPAPQNSPLSLQAKYDPMVNAKPLEMKEGGTLGSLGLNTDLYFDAGLTDESARLDRLERAVSALHKDLQTMAPTLQEFASLPPEQRAALFAPAAPLNVPQPAAPSAIYQQQAPSAAPVMNTGAIAPASTAASAAPTSLYNTQSAVQTAPTPYIAAPAPTQYRAALPPMPNGKYPGLRPAPLYNQDVAPAAPAAPIPPAQQVSTPPQNTAAVPPPAPTATGAQDAVNRGPRPVSNGNSAIVSGVRVGDHPDKVRLVFDVTKKTDYSADLDNNENLLIVELPNAKWNTPATQESFGGMPVLKNYKVDQANGGAGNIFILQLKKPTQILMQGKYPALSGTGERIVIDLKK